MAAPISFVHVRRAARIVHAGGVIAYPTEGVFGLGCDPEREDAVHRILDMKQRGAAAGLILIAATREQLAGWIAPTVEEEMALRETEAFVTWIVSADPHCPAWITGGRPTCAVRLTRHPGTAALCRETGLPLVSTSANRHGRPAALTRLSVRRQFGSRVDYILPGETGGAGRPSEIRVARTGAVLRAG